MQSFCAHLDAKLSKPKDICMRRKNKKPIYNIINIKISSGSHQLTQRRENIEIKNEEARVRRTQAACERLKYKLRERIPRMKAYILEIKKAEMTS